MTFIYEEVLGWDILRDGIGALREIHRRKFVEAIQRAMCILFRVEKSMERSAWKPEN
jgi:hypothetical protein